MFIFSLLLVERLTFVLHSCFEGSGLYYSSIVLFHGRVPAGLCFGVPRLLREAGKLLQYYEWLIVNRNGLLI